MNTQYDETRAREVEQAVMCEFGCRLSDIVSGPDTDEKKVTVYVLYSFLGFDKRALGRSYSITWPYIPTVGQMIEYRYLVDRKFREKVINVLKRIGYEGDAVERLRNAAA